MLCMIMSPNFSFVLINNIYYKYFAKVLIELIYFDVIQQNYYFNIK